MNIVHVSPNAPFNDGWGFQENLLPKYHAKLGHHVTLITTNQQFSPDGIITVKPGTFRSKDGFDVITLPYIQFPESRLTTIFSKLDIYELLLKLQPDYVFHHGLISRTIFAVIKYKRLREKNGKACWIVQDNHLDYNIGVMPRTLKQKALRSYYRMLNAASQKHVKRVFGVTPWRKRYAEDYFKISSDKVDVLLMGADDEKLDLSGRAQIRKHIREQYNIADEDFLIVTGGKIDEKKKIHILMEACGEMDHVKLLVFGSLSEQMKEIYQQLTEKYQNIVSVGWIPADRVYDYFFAADLVCFPGQHSVLWEQACASKVPCVFARWPGMEHVNHGGNADFFEEITCKAIQEKINVLCASEKLAHMKYVAESEATDIYLYSEIAKNSLL